MPQTTERAFVVRIALDDTQSLDGIAEDIADELGASGYDVLSVNPWDTGETATLASSLIQPRPIQQPPI